MNKQRATLFFLAILGVLLFSSIAAAALQNISALEMQRALQQNPRIYLLDVRTLGEYAQKRIKGAHLLPIDQIERRIQEIPRDRPIIVYCETGMRSTQVGRYLDSRGYRDVANLSQGIMAWQLRGFPIETGMP